MITKKILALLSLRRIAVTLAVYSISMIGFAIDIGATDKDIYPEPALVPPVKKIVRTQGLSCALDKERLKCWGEMHGVPPSLDSHIPNFSKRIIDFAISPTGDNLAVLLDYPGAAGYVYTHDSDPVMFPRIKVAKSIVWLYPDLNSYCVNGLDQVGHPVTSCGGTDFSEGTIVEYDSARGMSPEFSPCEINEHIEAKDAGRHSCAGAEDAQDFFDVSEGYYEMLRNHGIVMGRPSSTMSITLKNLKWNSCGWIPSRRGGDSTWGPVGFFSTSSFSFSTPIDPRFNGINVFWPYSFDEYTKINISNGRYEFSWRNENWRFNNPWHSWLPRDFQVVLPELECKKASDIKYSLLVPIQFLSARCSVGIDLNNKPHLPVHLQQFEKIMNYELGITNLQIDPQKSLVSFSNKSNTNRVVLKIPGLSYWDINTQFFKRVKGYSDFYVVSDDEYRIYTRDWKEIPVGRNELLGQRRRKFKVNGTSYSCAGIVCYKRIGK